MITNAPRSVTAGIRTDIQTFLTTLRTRLKQRFRPEKPSPTATHAAPSFSVLQEGEGQSPLSVFIPSRFGGRGQHVHECLAMLEACSYESLPLSLVAGINGALFLQPLSRYGSDQLQEQVYADFLQRGALGGLMITEPEYGSDALSMRTSFRPEGDGFRLRGTKHWGGLTGHADYWLLTARGADEGGDLERSISFFVWDRSLGGISVEEYYASLGLEMIPYGRNRIDTLIPGDRRLTAQGSGVRMLLDLLHRSRLQFPGMAMGYLNRLLDEANQHVQTRLVGGRALATYDQVLDRVAEIQAAYTTCSAMCAQTSELAAIDHDCSADALPANAIKTVVTDMMQAAGQSLLQLFGGAGYRRDHIAGSAVVDSRPFQIFEGSNDILYEQITGFFLKTMNKLKESRLSRFLAGFDGTRRASEYLRGMLDFTVDETTPQRKRVGLGRILGRVLSVEMVLKLGDRGFRRDLIDNALSSLRRDISGLLGIFSSEGEPVPIVDYRDGSSWLDYVQASAATGSANGSS